MSFRVGIDLGTTFSAVAMIDPDTKAPKIIENREGERITPSVIQFAGDKVIFGSEAESAFNAGEEGCAATFKRNMGDSGFFCMIDGDEYTAEDLSALLLKRLKEDAEDRIGDNISEAVITAPAYFYSPEREATIRAATRAGLKVKKIIDEPNAAALAYGINHWRENANILVYDLGGGTFDVTLTHMEKDGDLNSIVTRGDHLLGGRDWDNRMASLLQQKFSDEIEEEIDNDSLSMLQGLAEGVKKQLSSLEVAEVRAVFPWIGQVKVKVTRKEFEDSAADLLERTGILCRAVLEEANLKREDITDILLVGGSTRMPQISRYLSALFGKKPISHVNPDEAVALGAAIQAEKENVQYVPLMVMEKGGRKVTDRGQPEPGSGAMVKPAKKLGNLGLISLRETTAHAMGVIAVNDEENCYYNEIIIPANHPRPVRAAKKFRYYTAPDSDNRLEIYMLQGDSFNPLECLIPYRYIVSGIRHVDKGDITGVIIRVQYSYDDNGVIHVQARQGNETVNLPIRREEAPADNARFGQPVRTDAAGKEFGLLQGGKLSQNMVHKYKAITFSNVEWKKYDNINVHLSGAQFGEPLVHVLANEENIEFHGYNVSQMDEGVSYTIDAADDFEIKCNIDTSTIQPHPGGHVTISLGIISANLDENGGNIFMDSESVAAVDARFNLKMSLTKGGLYEVYVDGRLAGSRYRPTSGNIKVIFGFVHDAHYCHIISHAYITNIEMKQLVHQCGDDGSSDVDTWDD